MTSRSNARLARLAIRVSAVVAVAAWAVMGVIALLLGGLGSAVSGVSPPIFWPVWGFFAVGVAIGLGFTWRSRIAAVISVTFAIVVIGLVGYGFATSYFAGGAVLLFIAPALAVAASLILALAPRRADSINTDVVGDGSRALPHGEPAPHRPNPRRYPWVGC